MLNMPPVMTDIEVGLIDDEIKRDGYSIRRPENFGSLCEAAREEYLGGYSERGPVSCSRRRRNFPTSICGTIRGASLPFRSRTQRRQVSHMRMAVNAGHLFRRRRPVQWCVEHDFSVFMNNLRNRLMKVADDFGEDPARDKFWNACRVHHYPRGGGFMSMHRDTHFPIKLGDHPFYQVMVPLSVMGRDFVEGAVALSSPARVRS